ncbi:MAG: thiol:disulfide oxidoreductase [Rhodospirillaceae bacterium]|nr:thiol:disulfide oxidoreductase [Rhodospirillaceae bacterium]|tara:strand:+ start:1383 stop:2087 length:705 start_codon:yes stop_codon:yes gene_type:complete
MIDFYYWPTPNGWKVAILLEELGTPYNLIPVNIGKGDQFKPEFMAISPNNRMPAIVDHDVEGAPVSVFESGAIMFYLARKTGRFMSADPILEKEALEWLFWQTGNQGPMAGQLSHFVNYAPETITYAQERYRNEYDRCVGILETRLEGRDWIVGDDYSIADMICWPWILIAKPLTASLKDFPNVSRWRKAMKERPAVQAAVNLGKDWDKGETTEEERRMLYQQTSRTAAEQTGS